MNHLDRNLRFTGFAFIIATCCFCSLLASGSRAEETAELPAASKSPSEQSELDAAFLALMNNSVLTGFFTIDGGGAEGKAERYEIRNVTKLEDGLWGMQTRIAYGDKDITVPIAVPVKWAGKTPVISMQELFIPGLGTFSASVLFDGDRYAGTWQHGSKGGHLFGKIEKLSADKPADKPE